MIVALLFVLLLFNNLLTATASSQPVELGTTLVALRYRDGVIVGADSRTSVGSYVSHRAAQKLDTIGDYCVMARSGSAADTQALAVAANQHFQVRSYGGCPPTVSQIAHWLRQKTYGKGKSVSLILAGYDSLENRNCLFSIAQTGALLEHTEPFVAAGSGSSLIMGFLDRACSRELNESEAIKICVTALKLAMDRDGSSGGLCRLAVISSEGTRQLIFLPNDIQNTLQIR
jgi:20S proteasome subunit beta 1